MWQIISDKKDAFALNQSNLNQQARNLHLNKLFSSCFAFALYFFSFKTIRFSLVCIPLTVVIRAKYNPLHYAGVCFILQEDVQYLYKSTSLSTCFLPRALIYKVFCFSG